MIFATKLSGCEFTPSNIRAFLTFKICFQVYLSPWLSKIKSFKVNLSGLGKGSSMVCLMWFKFECLSYFLVYKIKNESCTCSLATALFTETLVTFSWVRTLNYAVTESSHMATPPKKYQSPWVSTPFPLLIRKMWHVTAVIQWSVQTPPKRKGLFLKPCQSFQIPFSPACQCSSSLSTQKSQYLWSSQ